MTQQAELLVDDQEKGPESEFETPGRWRTVWRQLLKSRQAMIGLAVLAVLFLMAYIGPLISPWEFGEPDFTAFYQPPSPEHWWGTTQTGQDIFTSTMVGLQKSLIIGLLVAVVSTTVAAVVGAFAGYLLGLTDKALMWVTDLLLVLPTFVILSILAPRLDSGSWLIFVVLLSAFLWMVTAKMVRGMAISLKEREYVLAARYMGLPAWKIIFRHIIPNMSSLLIVDATINVVAAILAETSLSYFGFGIQPPDVSLGSLIAAGTRPAPTHPWTFWFAAVLLIVTVLAVNLVGDGLRDALDPRAKARRRKRRRPAPAAAAGPVRPAAGTGRVQGTSEKAAGKAP
ncbi:ABC transporter permease [Allonocardiopsis opalescens]|uniref:Oligopeptide transport system permease protein OppC n=1 Tax=Allonocardiopsis opalescens TaxID=1144618 RepID=A0A2T0PVE8_9ACTN|nr:ABC transporter permease [Allonocardiopsis opalescens]PRX95515.1 peptide/nickel transport system permease protein [Allonocardiopsis opalescens]